MGTIYLSHDLRTLADQLAKDVDFAANFTDFFAPTRIVVPNRYLRKWLRLQLARSLGVAINIKFETLETALWNLFRETDPHEAATPAEPLDVNRYRLMVLSVLLEDGHPDLESLERYLRLGKEAWSRLSCRRAWRLADRFGQLIRDYEYARQDALIQPWLERRMGLPSPGLFHRNMERTQRALFAAITREPDGRRALLNRLGEKNYKTFPQYAMERMLAGDEPKKPGGTIHFFGFLDLSPLHGRSIAWLGKCFDIRVYHWNMLAGRLQTPINAESVNELIASFRSSQDGCNSGSMEFLRPWARAGAESLALLSPLIAAGFDVKPLTAPAPPSISVLDRLRGEFLGQPGTTNRIPQDTSLQIVGCPGILREVQAVHDSIVANLQHDPALRQTDIGVLTTDMARYRAPLQAVFERGAAHVQYNMVDFNAAGASTFAQAVLGMLDLALETFSRTRVFKVLLNPCFLTRLGVGRTEAMTWLEWARQLGVYHGWDAAEKAQHGYARSPRFSWKLALQRLRLGRYMDVSDDRGDGPARRFGDVVPFADVASTDRDRLDVFCWAVEGLLPALAELRKLRGSGRRWAEILRRLVNEFLDVPPDRPEEAHARTALVNGLETLSAWDHLRDTDSPAANLPLALVREFVQAQFKSLSANQGEYLIGGVTIAELQPMRPAPFEIVYVLGLGENLFPGGNQLSSFDLRGAERLPGDIRPAEERVFDLLTVLSAAGKKIYLLYNSHDLQRDQPLLPSTPLVQLERYLTDNILTGAFHEVAMPFRGEDAGFLDSSQQPSYQDVLVQPNPADRVCAILEAERAGRIAMDAEQRGEWARHCRSLRRRFDVDAEPEKPPAHVETVSLGELTRFLRLPAMESLRRHLRVEDDYDTTLEEFEPLVTSGWVGGELVSRTLQQVILDSAKSGADAAVAGWRDRFEQIYADARACSRAPEAAFGDIDQSALTAHLAERIHGEGGLESFLRERANCTFCAPVLLGSSMTPLGARLRFPALHLQLGADRHVRIMGSTALSWHSPSSFEILILSNYNKIRGDKIELAMLEPFLLYVSLLANDQPNADGIASQNWLAQRSFLLHVAHPGGMQTWSYPAGDVSRAEAAEYVNALVRDFLIPDQYDLLPIELLTGKLELCHAFENGSAVAISEDEYRVAICDALEDDREDFYPLVRVPLVVDMIHAEVPLDALAKVQRRLALIDRGPARNRSRGNSGQFRRWARS